MEKREFYFSYICLCNSYANKSIY